MPFCSQVRWDSCGKDCCSAILEAVTHFFLSRQYKQILSAALPRKKCSYPLLLKAIAGMPGSPFHKDILHTSCVIKQNALAYLYRLQYCPHHFILNLLLDFNQFVCTIPPRYKSKSKNY